MLKAASTLPFAPMGSPGTILIVFYSVPGGSTTTVTRDRLWAMGLPKVFALVNVVLSIGDVCSATFTYGFGSFTVWSTFSLDRVRALLRLVSLGDLLPWSLSVFAATLSRVRGDFFFTEWWFSVFS